MKVYQTSIPEVLLLEPQVYSDTRGYFFESFNQSIFDQNVINVHFIQDNESLSHFGTLRGLHYQLPPFAQAKLVRVIEGKVLDVAVDLRKGSSTFGKHVAVELSSDNHLQLFIPRGFAHGFLVLSEKAIFAYKVDNLYSKNHERSIIWSDPSLGIHWPLNNEKIVLSDKDQVAPFLSEADLFL